MGANLLLPCPLEDNLESPRWRSKGSQRGVWAFPPRPDSVTPRKSLSLQTPFDKYLKSTSCLPGTALGLGTVANKRPYTSYFCHLLGAHEFFQVSFSSFETLFTCLLGSSRVFGDIMTFTSYLPSLNPVVQFWIATHVGLNFLSSPALGHDFWY